jgi:2'-5' RNA ligase
MLLYLAILPPEDVKKKVLLIQKRFQKESVPVPHVTLTQPFSVTCDLKELTKDIEDIVNKFSVFEIKLNNLGIFDRGENSVLYAKVLSQGVLAEMHRKLSAKLLAKGCKTKKDFEQEFHLTLLKNIDHEKIIKIEEEIKDVKFNDTFTASEVTLFGIKGDEPWQVVRSFKLKENG